MNWGYKILLVILLFVAGIGTMVFVAMRQSNEMMDKDYYARELQFQKQIDAARNLQAAGGGLQLTDSGSFLKLSVPASAGANVHDGQLELLRPSDSRQDRNLLLVTDAEGVQLIPKAGFVRGNYKVRVSWTRDQVPYYAEESVYIN